jgi:CRP-like cAMP-binding protein
MMLVQHHGNPLIRNRILAGLSQADIDSLHMFLQPVSIKERSILQESNKPIEHVYFIESGIVSLRTLARDATLENAMVGAYGAVGVSVALGSRTSMHRSVVLVPGKAFRIRVDDLLRLVRERPQIGEHILRYVQSLMIHSSQTALCGVKHGLEERLACWVCLAFDALDGDILPITHDHLAIILGMRRAAVTESLLRFEEQGLIRKTRGFLRIQDLSLLQQRACCCYGIITNAYKPGAIPKIPRSSNVRLVPI